MHARSAERRGVSMSAVDFSKELGALPPVGFWDPLQLSVCDDDELAKAQFKRRRAVEIQHGRVAMFATLGYIVPEFFRWPGYCSPSEGIAFADVPAGLKAVNAIPFAGWLQIVAFIGTIEVTNLGSTPKEFVGDYEGYGAFGLPGGPSIADAEKKKKSLTAEINNGRLAMMAIMGMFFQDGLTGSAWGDWSNFAASPLRAVDFSKELGALPPVGFWDPLQLSVCDDDELAKAQFKRRRAVEIQHGRVAMFATLGYIVPEFFRWPGYCSPSEGIAFADVPAGLKAVNAIPFAGWLQIVAFIGTIEVTNLGSTPKEFVGDYEGYGAFGLPGGPSIADAEKKKKSLTAEINNGRLAMMAIMGMFFQDGLTGSAWGDWSNFAASPLRAVDFSKELGALPPVGFWDPLQLSVCDDDELAKAQFKRRRAVEIQHGRVAMFATLGYIVPEFFRWPGYCSPSEGIAFADVPAGLKAVNAIPFAGWLQIVAFIGTIEVTNLGSTPKEFVGDYEGYGAFGLPGGPSIADAEKKKKSLTAEINNGRLAMMAIMGMFFQDGLTEAQLGEIGRTSPPPLCARLTSPRELGALPPVGFWDPLQLSVCDDDELAKAQFKRRRAVEIQHGRVAMFATLGYIVPEFFRWPGYCSPSEGIAFADVPAGLKAVNAIPFAGWLQIVAFIGTIEVTNLGSTPKEFVGDYEGYGAFGLPGGPSIADAEKKKKSLTAEINNGRLAMMAIMGMFFQDGLTGSAWGDWSNFAASPLRAVDFSKELGALPPVGFWDPLQLSVCDDDELAKAQFKRRRAVEIQHGRVAMFATLGYIVPEFFRWPGYCSPSEGIAFADVPAGLKAVNAIPFAGWLQIVAFIGTIEVTNLGSTPKEFVGDYEGYGAFGLPGGPSIADAEKKKKSLTAEINNGRLAMMAIMGMFFQDGLTGSAWGDWSNFAASPLRAVDFSKELGALPPVGFWDPLQLSVCDDDELAKAQFKRRRAVEIQHGRVAMFATLGYIVPEFFRWPGYCSPSEGIAFADVPAGLKAVNAIPFAGWLQIVAFIGTIEVTNLGSTPKEFVGDYEGYGAFGLPGGPSIADAEKKKKSLTAEINNGRLAMMAIMGMFFQDGLTGGSAWGDWSNFAASPLRAVDFSKELGALPPVGFWDPLQLSVCDDDELAKAQFKRRRAVEIQHGRVAMFATLGYIVPEFFRWPGYCSPSEGIAFADVPAGLKAVNAIPFAGWLQIVAFIGTIEVTNLGSTPKEFVGDYEGYGAFGLPGGPSIADAEKKKKSLTAEINNGRLAMMAIMGMFFQDGLTGSAWGDWSNFAASPLRAVDFSKELGALPPVGFWDPLQLSVCDDDELAKAQFKRRRAVEIQHGRVAMFATLGYIVPEFFRWPGYCSPSEGIAFADVPAGLKAVNAIPFAGWLQIVAFIGTIEVTNLGSTPKEFVGDYEGYGAFGLPGGPSIADAEKKKKSLTAEINNGRLAMMAIMGMFFQDGLTGSAWGDWSNFVASPLRAVKGALN
ncbi:hypothetical protein ACP0BX_008344 [Amphidinium carterae]